MNTTEDKNFTSFIGERVAIAPENKVKAIELYRAYEQWQGSNGGPVMTVTAFGRRMVRMSIAPRHRLKGGLVYQGIKLR